MISNRSKRRKQRKEEQGVSSTLLASVPFLAAVLLLLILGVGSSRNPDFWSTPDQRGDALFRAEKFGKAAKTYTEPQRIAAAQYRNGDFEDAARTFARVPGAVGAFDQGNAHLMHGKYDAAITSYDRALGFHPHWNLAEDNKALAVARKKMLDDSGKDGPDESADSYKPDEIVFDLEGDDKKGGPKSLNGDPLSDQQLRESWLRRVQTTPGDFLRAKFAYQDAHAKTQAIPEKKEVKP